MTLRQIPFSSTGGRHFGASRGYPRGMDGCTRRPKGRIDVNHQVRKWYIESLVGLRVKHIIEEYVIYVAPFLPVYRLTPLHRDEHSLVRASAPSLGLPTILINSDANLSLSALRATRCSRDTTLVLELLYSRG